LHVLKWNKEHDAISVNWWYLYDPGWTAHSHAYWGGKQGVLLRNAIAGKHKIHLIYIYLTDGSQLGTYDPAQLPGTYSFPQTQALPAFVSEISAFSSAFAFPIASNPDLSAEIPDPFGDKVASMKASIEAEKLNANTVESQLNKIFDDEFINSVHRAKKRPDLAVIRPKLPKQTTLIGYTANTSFLVTYRAANLSITYTAGTPAPPVIVQQPNPVSQTVSVGSPITLAVKANGFGDLHYQWYFATSGSTFTAIPGQANNTFSQLARLTDEGDYAVLVSDAGGNTLSDSATVLTANNVETPPFGTMPPPTPAGLTPSPSLAINGAVADVPKNSSFTLSVVTTDGSPIPANYTYQWLYAAPGAASYSPIAGETKASYHQDNARVSDGGYYLVSLTPKPTTPFPPPAPGGASPSALTYTSYQPATVRITSSDSTTILPGTWPTSLPTISAFPSQPSETSSMSYTDDEPTWYGFGGMVPVNEIRYMVNGVSAAHQVAYGSLNFYIPRIEPPLMSQRKLPHIVLAIPISGKALLHPFLGLGFSLNYFDIVAGINPDWENQPIDMNLPNGPQPHHHFVIHGIFGFQITGANISTMISTFKGH
jgi:hypothetical protein